VGQSRQVTVLVASVVTLLAVGTAVAQSPPSTVAPSQTAPPRPTAPTSAPNAQTARILSVAGHRLAISHGFVRPFRRNFGVRNGFAIRRNLSTGGWWPYDYDYGPADAYGDMNTASNPETGGFAPEPTSVPVCHRSEESVRVPAEGGGTRQIKIIRCP
jgi:hypothetical protein